MSITCECEKCHRQFQVADNLTGKRARCSRCGHIFTIPGSNGPTASEIYALDADRQSTDSAADQPSESLKANKKKTKKTKASGLFGLSALSLWGFNAYRGLVVALLVVALIVGGAPKFILAMAGLVLCVGPFIASGFNYRFGVAFRDGMLAGLLYMFFVPYRIHYRLTHQELFRTLRAPTLTLRDFSLLLLGLCFLPVVILGAQEMDKLKQKRAPAVDWTQFVGRGGNAAVPAVPALKRAARPPLLGLAKPRNPKITTSKPVLADTAVAEPKALQPAAVEPEAQATPSLRVGDAASQHTEPGSGRPQFGRPPRFTPGAGRPFLPRSSKQAASPAFADEATVEITVHGVPDAQTRQELNKALIAILKPSGSEWRVSFSTIEGKTIFRVCPVADPQAFADKIEFGKVTRVEARSIEVEVRR